jgi:hypothetical protein
MTLPIIPSDYATLGQLFQIQPNTLLAYMDHQRNTFGPHWLLTLHGRIPPEHDVCLLLTLIDNNQHPLDWIQFYNGVPIWNISQPDISNHYEYLQHIQYVKTIRHWKQYNPSPSCNLERLER